MRVCSRHPSVSQSTEPPLLVAASHRDQVALSIACILGDDADYAIDRVGAPQRRAGTANHFDSLDVLEHRTIAIPKNPGEKRTV